MRVSLVVALVLLPAVPATPGQNDIGADAVVTTSPVCPEWQMPPPSGGQMIPPTIAIRYNPKAPGARLTSSKTVDLIFAEARLNTPYESTTVPMLRASDGMWQAEFTPKKNNAGAYAIFFFRDGNGRVDNNSSRYWEILYCYRSHLSDLAVWTQASTYEGRLLAPGIQRPPDLARAIEILKADVAARPSAVMDYSELWRLELEKGRRSPAAYAQVGEEIDAFLTARGKDLLAMRQAVSFVASTQNKLPTHLVQRFRAALIALPQEADPIEINAVTKEVHHIPREIFARRVQPEVTRDLAEFDYWSIDLSKQDPHEKADAYLAFVDKYPASLRVDSAYQDAFQCEKEANDIAAAEAISEKRASANPKSVWPFIELAQLYIDKKIKPERAVELLDKAKKIYEESEPPSSHVHYRRITDNLEPLRGQAHLLLKNWPAARADFEAAFKAAPDKPELAYALGQTCEQMGDKAAALDAYLAAATAGYQQNPSPGEAYERLFVALGLGTKQQAEERIASRIAESNRSAATEYTPLALNRPAPDFAFTDLSGKRFDNESGKGKPTVITFWGIWCAPCIAELPGIAKFQIQHPEANALAVEIGNKPDDVKAFLAAHKLTALHVATRRDWPEEFGLTGAPTTIVLDRFGQIQFLHAGQLANVEAILGKDLETLPASN